MDQVLKVLLVFQALAVNVIMVLAILFAMYLISLNLKKGRDD